jgi:hypothetical protein
MLRVTYYARAISDEPVTEYFPTSYPGNVGIKAWDNIVYCIVNSKADLDDVEDLTIDALSRALNDAPPPRRLFYKRNGKFDRVHRREW